MGAQWQAWRTHFGESAGDGSSASANATVPEPATLVMLIVAAGTRVYTTTQHVGDLFELSQSKVVVIARTAHEAGVVFAVTIFAVEIVR